MTTQGQTKPRATLRVSGSLLLIDAQHLEEACRNLCRKGRSVTINLTNIDFLTDSAAEILCRLKHYQEVVIEGTNLFVQQVMQRQELL